MSREKRHLAAVGQNLNAVYKDAFLLSIMLPRFGLLSLFIQEDIHLYVVTMKRG